MDKYILKIDNSGDNKEELIVKKSKFISKVWYISSKEEAEEIIEEQRKIYADARHVVFAYRLENVGKYTDDKEPQGTAGKPIYSLLEKENIFNVLVIVIRYFGGILLGTGPLTRAYVTAAKMVVDKNEKVEYIEYEEIETVIEYSEESSLINKIKQENGIIQDIIRDSKVQINFKIPKENKEKFSKYLFLNCYLTKIDNTCQK